VREREQWRIERRFVGLSYDSDLDTPPEMYRYDLGYEVDVGVEGSDGIFVRTIPPFLAAVLPCRGGGSDFIAAWDHLQRGFLPASEWMIGRGPQMEIYYVDPRPHGMAYWDMDCVLPVQKEEEGNV